MKINLFASIILITLSIIILIIHHVTRLEFLLHLAAIPLEVLLAVFIVEQFLEHRENREKRRQLMYIKSYMFRSEMRDLFVADFAALQSPPVTFEKIRNASLQEMKDFRKRAEIVEYKSLEAMEPLIQEYVRASHVWYSFLERAMTYGFENVFQDMIFIIHFIHTVKSFKEKNPEKPFIHEAAKSEALIRSVMKVLGDGIRSFLDYAIELKEKQPKLFDEVLSDYEDLSKG
jgi:hypothetical protein